MNNVISKTFPQLNIYIYKNYCLEEIKTIIENNDQTIKPNGEIVKKNIDSRDSVTYYILTNVKTDMCYQFNADKVKPKLLSTFPKSNKAIKKIGHNLNDNNIASKELPKYIHINDTTINNRVFKKLIYITDIVNNNTTSKKTSTVYLDKDLKNSPFHPFSKYLDKKFDGLSTIVEITFKNQTFKMEYAYTDGLNQIEINQIEKYIKLTPN